MRAAGRRGVRSPETPAQPLGHGGEVVELLPGSTATTCRPSSRKASSRSFSRNTASPGSCPVRSSRPYLTRRSNSRRSAGPATRSRPLADHTSHCSSGAGSPARHSATPTAGLPHALAAVVGEPDRPTRPGDTRSAADGELAAVDRRGSHVHPGAAAATAAAGARDVHPVERDGPDRDPVQHSGRDVARDRSGIDTSHPRVDQQRMPGRSRRPAARRAATCGQPSRRHTPPRVGTQSRRVVRST